MAISHIRTRRRVAAALSAAALMATLTAALTGAAREPASPAQPRRSRTAIEPTARTTLTSVMLPPPRFSANRAAPGRSAGAARGAPGRPPPRP